MLDNGSNFYSVPSERKCLPLFLVYTAYCRIFPSSRLATYLPPSGSRDVFQYENLPIKPAEVLFWIALSAWPSRVSLTASMSAVYSVCHCVSLKREQDSFRSPAWLWGHPVPACKVWWETDEGVLSSIVFITLFPGLPVYYRLLGPGSQCSCSRIQLPHPTERRRPYNHPGPGLPSLPWWPCTVSTLSHRCWRLQRLWNCWCSPSLPRSTQADDSVFYWIFMTPHQNWVRNF